MTGHYRTSALDEDIAHLDLESVAYKVVLTEGWDLAKVDDVTQKYRAFLQVIRKYGQQEHIAPTQEIDLFWHAHILDTQRYIEDCDLLFGSYLHHYPYSGVTSGKRDKEQAVRVSRTVQLINQYLH